MASATRTLTINAAFFQEIKEVNQDLLQSLFGVKRLCDKPSAILMHKRYLVSCLEEARDQLAVHFALEEAYGYFEDPVTVAPQLCDRALALRSQHGPLYVRICALADRARDLLNVDSTNNALALIVKEFGEFFEQFQRHEDQENELILQEYSDDVGVGD